MEGVTEDFVSKFYFLQGNLVGERKKNFSTLLRELKAHPDPHLVDHFVKNIQPRNYLESLFKIDALIYFKKTRELLEVLKENNEVFISKIFKQQWFFEEAFKNVDIDDLVNEFVPNLSFASRMKFLKKIFLILDQERVDKLFSAIYIRYGLWVARKFLHFCSPEKIKDVLNVEEIQLESNQVKYLFDKGEELFLNYLDYHVNSLHSIFSDTNVLEHIGHKKLDLLLRLTKDQKVTSITLGKRTTKKAFDLVKSDIPENVDKYMKQLNKNVMFRKLGKDFNNIYNKRLPSNFSDLSIYNEFNILKYIPKSKRWNVFRESCSIKFPSHNIMELSFYDLLRHCPDRDIIKKKAEVTYKESDDNKYLQYMDTSTSITLIKEKINVTSDIYNRRKLVELLIDSCSQNKDFNKLETVLKYICYRHRNEDLSFRHSILQKIKNSFKLQDFNENHWNYVNEQIKILRIQKDFSFWRYKEYSNHYLEFLFKNNKDIKDALKEYIDDILESTTFQTLNLNNPKIEKRILIEIFKYTDEGYITKGTDKNRNNFDDIVNAIMSFNDTNPDFFIEFEQFKTITQYVYDVFNKTRDFTDDQCTMIDNILSNKSKNPKYCPNLNDSIILSVFLNLYKAGNIKRLDNSLYNYILKKNRNNLENELVVYYFKQFINQHPDRVIINWYLINEPETIKPYFQNIVLATEYTKVNLELCKFYSHFDFDRKLIDFFNLKLMVDKPDDKDLYLKKIMKLLSTDEFIQAVNQFLPEKEKLDLEDQKMMDIYKVQCNIAKLLHLVNEPHKMLPTVMKFCLGDYLQSTLAALYSVFYRSPEKQLSFYVDSISKRAVSVRKHAVFLSCELLDQNCAINILTTTQHSNVSSQKHLLLATLKYFNKNPCETLLNLVITNMSTIEKSDKETLESLIDYYHSIPKKYKLIYIERCWTFYESLEQQEVKIEQYLVKLLSALIGNQDILTKLSTSFVKTVLINYLDSKKLYNSMDFAVAVLIYREVDRIENFDLIFNIISKMKKQQIHQFFTSFACRSLDINFVNLFSKYWNKYFTKINTFWEHIYLNLWNRHLTQSSQDNFAQNIILYLNEVINEFSFCAFDIFKNVFKEFLSNQPNIYKYEIFEKMLLNDKTPCTCVLILKIMTPEKRSDCVSIYNRILEIFKNIQEPIITIYYNQYLSDNVYE